MKKKLIIGGIVLLLIIVGDYYFSNKDNSEDGCLNARELFATEAEALKRTEAIGCTGSHTHPNYGDKIHMACENHEQSVNMNIVC